MSDNNNKKNSIVKQLELLFFYYDFKNIYEILLKLKFQIQSYSQ